MGSIFVLYIQPTIPTYTLLKLPDVYVGIVGWIYRTKIDPSSLPLSPYFFEQWSSLLFFSFHRNVFSLTCNNNNTK